MNGMLSVLVQFIVDYCLTRFQIGLLVCLINLRSLIIINTCKGALVVARMAKMVVRVRSCRHLVSEPDCDACLQPLPTPIGITIINLLVADTSHKLTVDIRIN